MKFFAKIIPLFLMFSSLTAFQPHFIHKLVNGFKPSSCEYICEKCSCKMNEDNILKNVRIFKPKIDSNETKSLIFFSGGNSFISHELYSDFLNKLSNYNLYIYVIPFQYEYFDHLLEILKNKHEEIIPISHSSGFSVLAEKVSNKNFIKKAVFLDPVYLSIKSENKIKMKYLEDVLFLRADKSYQGKFIPFIPEFLEINKDKIEMNKECNIQIINTEEYGHCDLLNPLFSNMIHNYFQLICDSSENRNPDFLESYIDWLVENIFKFVK